MVLFMEMLQLKLLVFNEDLLWWLNPNEVKHGVLNMETTCFMTLWISWCPHIDSAAPLKRQKWGAILWCTWLLFMVESAANNAAFIPHKLMWLLQRLFIIEHWIYSDVTSLLLSPLALTAFPPFPQHRPVPAAQPGAGGSSPYFRWRTEPSSPSSPWPPSRTAWSPSAEFSSSSPARGRGDLDRPPPPTPPPQQFSDQSVLSTASVFRSFVDLLSCTSCWTLVSSTCVWFYLIFSDQSWTGFFLLFFCSHF